MRMGVVREGDWPLFEKKGRGRYTVRLRRGTYFERRQRQESSIELSDSALYDSLRSIGLEDRSIHRLVRAYPHRILREWADITLAACERFGKDFFKSSPQAYFVDNVKRAVQDGRTAPDWWHDLRKAEQQQMASRHRGQRDGNESSEMTLTEQAGQSYTEVMDDLFGHFVAAGQSVERARKNVERCVAEPRRRKPRTRPQS